MRTFSFNLNNDLGEATNSSSVDEKHWQIFQSQTLSRNSQAICVIFRLKMLSIYLLGKDEQN